MSLLTPNQQTFVNQLARQTGLNPGVLSAWSLAEESGGAARSRDAQGNQNWLNIGYFDSGPAAWARTQFQNPVQAANLTAQFLRGQRFGASPGIRSILRTAGQSPDAQIQAIANSGWASSDYNGGNDLRSLYARVGSGPGPGAATPTATPANSVAAPATTAGPDLSGLQSILDANARLAKIPAVRLPHVSVPAVIQGTSQVDAHTTAANLPSGSQIGQAIVRAAKQFLGVPYVWGGTSPKGFDCSGLTQYVFAKFGIRIPRVSEDQVKAGRAVPLGQQQPGDLLFFKHANGDVGHVGIFVGNGMMLEAPHTGDVVKIIPLAGYTPVYAVRRFA